MGLPGGSGRAASTTLDDVELAERIIAEGWTDAAAMAAGAGAQRDSDPALYATVLRLGRNRAEDLVSWVWSMRGGLPPPTEDRVQKLRNAVQAHSCCCSGGWPLAADQLLHHQGIAPASFKRSILRALALGRRKGTNVLVTGAPDSGKSFLFKPLAQIFKACEARGQKERFPCQGLPDAEVCVLQDIRYESFGLCWDDWLRWGEGETVMINVPRNTAGARSIKYVGTAPLFATMADMFSYPLADARRDGRSVERENAQFRSRWACWEFTRPIPIEQRDVTLQACACCAARWLTSEQADDNNEPETPRSKRARLAQGRLLSHELQALGLSGQLYFV